MLKYLGHFLAHSKYSINGSYKSNIGNYNVLFQYLFILHDHLRATLFNWFLIFKIIITSVNSISFICSYLP